MYADNKTFIHNRAREGFFLSVNCIHIYPGSRCICVTILRCWKSGVCSGYSKTIICIVSYSYSVIPSTFRKRVGTVINEVK